MERALIGEYFATIDELLGKLDHDNHALAVEIATIPEHIRGYGHIKDAHLAKARARWDELIAMWRSPPAARAAA
jgi:indolepyruvate ferredoxin oxidoreductase